jgi:hypothetical protein
MRCSVCKAENDKGPQCRRCKVDLSLLFELEAQRERLLAAARHALGRGQWPEAIRQAEEADRLRHNEESWQLVAVAHLLNRNFAAAWRCYRSGRAGVQQQGEGR